MIVYCLYYVSQNPKIRRQELEKSKIFGEKELF